MKQRKGLVQFKEVNKVRVKLYDTDILVLETDKMVLNSGGWLTKHTKNCINDNLPVGYELYQSNKQWYVSSPNSVYQFVDGLVIYL